MGKISDEVERPMTGDSARKMFDSGSKHWVRDEPRLLSDWTARPFLLDWCLPVTGKQILDMGCGEGYFTRKLARNGARQVSGIDISPGMITLAQAQESQEALGIHYSVGCATDFEYDADSRYDLISAVFVYNYVTIDEMKTSMSRVYEALSEGGRFVFSLPHPANPFIAKEDSRFHFERVGGWFSGKDQAFEGRMAMRDGTDVVVRCIHKTFEDVMHGLKDAGFSKFPDFRELTVTEEHIAFDPEFFQPLYDQPLHIAFRIEK